jgi:hypothetical protein
MLSLPDENDLEYYKNSESWFNCPICNREFEYFIKWPKYNRDAHVKACIKQKKSFKQGTKRKIGYDSKPIATLDSFLSNK